MCTPIPCREEWQFGAREDWRYTDMAKQYGRYWWILSFFATYLVQHVMLVSALVLAPASRDSWECTAQAFITCIVGARSSAWDSSNGRIKSVVAACVRPAQVGITMPLLAVYTRSAPWSAWDTAATAIAAFGEDLGCCLHMPTMIHHATCKGALPWLFQPAFAHGSTAGATAGMCFAWVADNQLRAFMVDNKERRVGGLCQQSVFPHDANLS